MENGRSCEDFLNMQSHQAIADNKIVNSAIACCVLIFWHWCAHYLSMHLDWCQPAPPHHNQEGVLGSLLPLMLADLGYLQALKEIRWDSRLYQRTKRVWERIGNKGGIEWWERGGLERESMG